MTESILVTGKRISSMELVTNVTGTEKIPTGQPDDLAITPNQIADHTISRGDLASHGDLSQVEVDLTTQIATLAGDVAAEEAARIAADNLKVDKEGSVSSVAGRVGDVLLTPSDVLVEGFGSQEDVNTHIPKPFLSGYAYGLGERVVLNSGVVVKSTVEGNLGDPNLDMSGWVSVISDQLSDTIMTFTSPEAGVDPVTGVADGAYFNVRSASNESYVDEYQNVGGVPTPTGNSYPSSAALNNIQHNNLKDRDADGAHPASAILDESGLTQQQINGGLESVSDLALITSLKDDSRVYVKSYHAGAGFGGGEFIYDAASTETANDVTIFGSGTGRWKRPPDEIITPYHAGAIDNQDSTDALERFAAYAKITVSELPKKIELVGTFNLTRPFHLNLFYYKSVYFDLKLTAIAPMLCLMSLRASGHHTGTLKLVGTGAVHNYNSMTVKYGIALNGVQFSTLPRIETDRFKYFGVTMDQNGVVGQPLPNGLSVYNNTCANIPAIVATDCGCSQIAGKLNNLPTSYTFSDPVHTGSSGTSSQRTTIQVSGLPFDSDLINQHVFAVINNITYKVDAIDFANNKISLYPWMEIAEPVSGTISFLFGGGLFNVGSNSGPTNVSSLIATRCATGICDAALYGAKVRDLTAQACGAGIVVGYDGATINQSSSYIGVYTEQVFRNLIYIGQGNVTVLNRYGHFQGPPFIECERITSNNRSGDYGANADSVGWKQVFMPNQLDNSLDGLYYKGRSKNKDISRADIGLSPTQVVPRLYKRDSWTIVLRDITARNATSGIDDAIIGFVGTGSNAAPTGAFTFVPPSGWKINSGAVDASLIVSGFSGPALFLCYWEIDAKNIIVRQLTQRAVAQADSAATDIDGLKTDFNTLLAKLRSAGLLSN